MENRKRVIALILIVVVVLAVSGAYLLNTHRTSEQSQSTVQVVTVSTSTIANLQTRPSALCQATVRSYMLGDVVVAPNSFSPDLAYPPYLRKYSTNYVLYAFEWENGTWIEYKHFPDKAGMYLYGYDGQMSVTVVHVDKPVMFELWSDQRLYQYNATFSLVNFDPQYFDIGNSNRGLRHAVFVRFWNPNPYPITIHYMIDVSGIFSYGNMTSLTTCP